MSPQPRRSFISRGFTLTELLAVIAIMAILMAGLTLSLPGIFRAEKVNGAITDLSSTLEAARAYAMSNHTNVRVALGSTTSSSGLPTLVVLGLYSSDGSETASMATTNNWRAFTPPLILENFKINNALNGRVPDTSGDPTPSNSNFGSISWTVGNLGTIEFTSFIEFDPVGESSIIANNPARFIKVAVQQADQSKNPFILRLSGINGTVSILRANSL